MVGDTIEACLSISHLITACLKYFKYILRAVHLQVGYLLYRYNHSSRVEKEPIAVVHTYRIAYFSKLASHFLKSREGITAIMYLDRLAYIILFPTHV
jgi:hypothetical protein